MTRKREAIYISLAVVVYAGIGVVWVWKGADLVARYFSEMVWLAW